MKSNSVIELGPKAYNAVAAKACLDQLTKAGDVEAGSEVARSLLEPLRLRIIEDAAAQTGCDAQAKVELKVLPERLPSSG